MLAFTSSFCLVLRSAIPIFLFYLTPLANVAAFIFITKKFSVNFLFLFYEPRH
jgi:hypothetical protein